MKRASDILLIATCALFCASFGSAAAGIWLHSNDWGLTSLLTACTAGICALAAAIMRT